MSTRLGLSLFSVLLVGLCACSAGELRYQDLPVEYDQQETKGKVSGEKTLLIGIYEEQLFKELKPGEKLHIIQGFQGGAWIHLSVRITGMPGAGKIKVVVHDKVTSIDYDLQLLRSAEGFLEAYDIPVPIKEEGTALEALYGKQVELEMSFTSEAATVTSKVKLVLSKG